MNEGTEIEKLKKKIDSLAEELLMTYEELGLFYDISTSMRSSPDFETITELILSKASETMEADKATILILEESESTLKIVKGLASGRWIRVNPMDVSLERTILSKAIHAREGLIINDITKSGNGIDPLIATKSFLSVPMRSKDKIIGLLTLGDKKDRDFTSKDLKLSSILSSQAALIIENVRLIVENATMAEIGRIMNSTLEIEEVYGRFAEKIHKLIPFDRITITWTKLKEATVATLYDEGPCERTIPCGSISLAGSLDEQVMLKRAGLIVQMEDENVVENAPSGCLPYRRAGVRSIISSPLYSKEDIVGCLHLQSITSRAYTDQDLKVAGRVSDQIAGALVNAQLFNERKKAEAALARSEERFRELYDHAPVGYFEYDATGRITNVNRTNLEMLGYSAEEMIGQAVWKFTAEEETARKRIQGKLAGTLPPDKNVEQNYLRKDATVLPVWIVDRPILDEKGGTKGIRCTIQDITQLKQAETEQANLLEQLHQAQKMEAIGTLAGGVAHDFNNILASILGFAELASLDLAGNSKTMYNLQQSMRAAHRAKDLVQQILSFSRQGRQERKPLDIRPIVKEGLKFLRASLPATIEIRQDVEEDLAAIDADPTQIYQVLINLCTNAAHAMEEKGGILKVSLGNSDVVGKISAVSRSVEPGLYVRLQVSDTGAGMPPEVVNRIFDPYFTTKEVGKGTGLGLAVVHGIVKSYGGGIAVVSEVGKGSLFDVYFPRIAAVNLTTELNTAEHHTLGGHERILLVDDEKTIAEIGQHILEHLGYEAVVRTSSIEALELFRVQANRFDLVVTDMTMPNMTGDRLAQEILKIRPGIPIIMCTGFSEQITEEKAKAIGIQEFVMKPLAMKELAGAIRRVLG